MLTYSQKVSRSGRLASATRLQVCTKFTTTQYLIYKRTRTRLCQQQGSGGFFGGVSTIYYYTVPTLTADAGVSATVGGTGSGGFFGGVHGRKCLEGFACIRALVPLDSLENAALEASAKAPQGLPGSQFTCFTGAKVQILTLISQCRLPRCLKLFLPSSLRFFSTDGCLCSKRSFFLECCIEGLCF